MFMYFEKFHSGVVNIPFEGFMRYVHSQKFWFTKIKTLSHLLVVVRPKADITYVFGFSDDTHCMSSAEMYT